MTEDDITRPDGRSEWQQKMIELDTQNADARRGLVQQVARERAFRHLDPHTGRDPARHAEALEKITESYLDGSFFLRHLSLFYDVSPELSLVVYNLRQDWIQQYDLQTVPELMLVDQAMLGYLHAIRLNKQIADMMALTEVELFYPESPVVKIKKDNRLNNEFDGFVAEDAIKKLQERLMPLMERFNQMFLRNLRALREIKTHPVNINIGQAGQVNVGQQQINVDKA